RAVLTTAPVSAILEHMLRSSTSLALASWCVLGLCGWSTMALPAPPVAKSPQQVAALRSGYAPVDGLQIYYEVYGQPREGTPPLILMHGGDPTIQTSFADVLPLLAKSRQVIAFEQQGHGHTADRLMPYS